MLMPTNILISVLLPVYNGMPFLSAAVESILNQSFNNFELIVINNGSNDDTENYLNSLTDARIKVITTDNIGLIAALNLGMHHCQGKYIARMDADDVCDVQRLQKQLDVLENNQRIGVVCSDIVKIDAENRVIGHEHAVISNNKQLLKQLCFQKSAKPIIHPSVMLRTELLQRNAGYRNYQAAEDRDLWLRLSNQCDFYRIPAPLLYYRVTGTSVSRKNRLIQKNNSLLAVLNYHVNSQLGIDMYVSSPMLWRDMQRQLYRYARQQSFSVAAFEDFKTFISLKAYFNAFVSLYKNKQYINLHFLPFFRAGRDNQFLIKNLKIIIELYKLKKHFLIEF